MNHLGYLRQFHDISEQEYLLLTERIRTKTFKKGHSVIVPGQVQKELFFVTRGVQMSWLDRGNKTHVIAFTYFPNLCAIPESFCFQQPSPYFLTCISDSEFGSIHFDELQLLFEQCRNIERLFRKMTEAMLAGIISRHAELLALTMEERYKAFCQRSPHLLKIVPHKYLASYLGIDATNFSKLFNNIKF